MHPDFISVTYGAGGSLTDNRTTELSSLVKEKYGVEPVAHLTCISSTKDEIDIILDDLKSHGIENILALRGDIPVGQDPKGEFNYAYELISHIKNRGDFKPRKTTFHACIWRYRFHISWSISKCEVAYSYYPYWSRFEKL